MSRRRRKGNSLLGRILLISVIVHVIAIPILAHFGAFEKIRRQIMGPTVIIVPPAPEEKNKQVTKKEQPKHQAARVKGRSQTAKSTRARANSPHPPVIAANSPSTGGPAGGDGPVIDTGGSGKVGIPPSTNGGTGTAQPGGGPVTQPKPTPTTEPKPEPTTKPEPKPKPPAKPHVPVIATAEPTFQPQPDIPDDLRSEAVDATTVVEINVSPDGAADSVRISQSSGNDQLDRLAVNAAKKWRFKPATRDGEPIASKVRLHVQFKVD